MTRLWFKDGTFMDVTNDQLQYWLRDGDLDYIQPYNKDGKLPDEDDD